MQGFQPGVSAPLGGVRRKSRGMSDSFSGINAKNSQAFVADLNSDQIRWGCQRSTGIDGGYRTRKRFGTPVVVCLLVRNQRMMMTQRNRCCEDVSSSTQPSAHRAMLQMQTIGPNHGGRGRTHWRWRRPDIRSPCAAGVQRSRLLVPLVSLKSNHAKAFLRNIVCTDTPHPFEISSEHFCAAKVCLWNFFRRPIICRLQRHQGDG